MMASVKRFEDLDIRSLAQEQTTALAAIFYDKSFKNRSFQDQIMRASISVSNNIAEGFERQSDKEFARFLYIAKGSCGEVRSMLHLAEKFDYISYEQKEHFLTKHISLSVKISNLIKHLHQS